MTESVLTFHQNGIVTGLYTEAIPLTELGYLTVERASSIEFNGTSQKWEVKSLDNKTLFSHHSRQTCLEWGHQQFNERTT